MREATKIFLVKDHVRKGKESFHVKTKESSTVLVPILWYTSSTEDAVLVNFRKSL